MMVHCSNDTSQIQIKLISDQVHKLRKSSVRISIGEPFLVEHAVLFSQNRIFDEASVMNSMMLLHAPDTVFIHCFPLKLLGFALNR
jgi:hypothetical protein